MHIFHCLPLKYGVLAGGFARILPIVYSFFFTRLEEKKAENEGKREKIDNLDFSGMGEML